MTTIEIAMYGVVGVISVLLSLWSLSRKQDRTPRLFRGFALLSFTYAVMFVFILARALSSGLGPNRMLVVGLAAGLFSVSAVLFANQAFLARRGDRDSSG